jgi:catalase
MEKDDTKPPVTTTSAGIPAAGDDDSLTAGPDGPILLHDHYVVQKMAHFNWERVPARVVHAKGGGAHGYFEANAEARKYTKADFLQPGRRTQLLARFSSVADELAVQAGGAGQSLGARPDRALGAGPRLSAG